MFAPVRPRRASIRRASVGRERVVPAAPREIARMWSILSRRAGFRMPSTTRERHARARSPVPFVFDVGSPQHRGDPFLALHREMNRLFDDAMRGAGPAAGGGGSAATAMAPPRMNVSETGQAIRVEVELPGVSEEDVQVELADDLLTVRGEMSRAAAISRAWSVRVWARRA